MNTPVIRAKLELVPQKDIKRIESLDAGLVSTTPDKYILENELGYYVIINTWMMIVHQYSLHGFARIIDKIMTTGLLPVIKEADAAASSLINNGYINVGMFSELYRDVQSVLQNTVLTPITEVKDINKDPFATMLFILRYPKRFSPISADKIINESIQDFINVENKSKLIQRKERPYWMIQEVREEMYKMIDWASFLKEATAIVNDQHCLTFTSGATSDASASLGRKLRALSASYPEYFRNPFGIPYSGAYPQYLPLRWGRYREELRLVQVRAVPKSYKNARIIAMETTFRQGKAAEIGHILQTYLPDAIPLHDQAVNQAWAHEGALNGLLATLDLSHASDCITKTLFWDIFPRSVCNLLYPYLGTHTNINGVWRPMQQMSTAGNALTFILESMVFLAIARAADKYYYLFSDSSGYYDRSMIPSVYGDDIVTNTDSATLTIEWLEKLGFVVNDSKSFYDPNCQYRESCGAEYWGDVDVSSYYFPRFPIIGTMGDRGIEFSDRYLRDSYSDELADSTSSVVSLQHRLYYVCYDAAYFLAILLKEASKGQFSTSNPCSEVNDIWDYEDTICSQSFAPAAEVVSERVGLKTVRRFRKIGILDQMRTLKYLPSTRYRLKGVISDMDQRLYDLYKYNEFLRHGPRYDDDLSRLLGVSSKPRPALEVFGIPYVKWSKREIDYLK